MNILRNSQLAVTLMASLFFLNAAHGADAEPDFLRAVLLGGEATAIIPVPSSFSLKTPAQNLTEDQEARHGVGDLLFERQFSGDPARPEYGLGPVFNHLSCAGCHMKDGRGSLPRVDLGSEWTRLRGGQAIFLRTSIEDGSAPKFDASDLWGAPKPVPGFGTQLFHAGISSLRPDSPGSGLADVYFKYEFSTFTYPDGTQVRLRKPVFKVENAWDGPNSRLFQNDVVMGPRATPQMGGLGLLEAIREEDILALADRDLSEWGIHGKPNWVLDRAKEMRGEIYPVSLGRFGLKASTPTVEQQTMGALHGDLGVTSQMFPEESILGTDLFESFRPFWKDVIEIDQDRASTLVFYSQTLAVLVRRNAEKPEVLQGGKVFQRVGCTGCHQPSFTTGTHPTIPQFSNQKIYPYTDMLLHDMGEGLADGRRDFRAGGRDWKTRPLWNMGVVLKVNPLAGLLHDGRAETLEQAILWHGGEAEISRDKFVNQSKHDRDALIAFLKSL